MPGIFSLITDRQDGEAVFTRLTESGVLYPWQQAASVCVEPGRVWVGVVVNGTGDDSDDTARHLASGHGVTVAVDGHIVRSLEDCGVGHLLARAEYAPAVLLAYAKFGSDFAAKLEGQFTCIVHDANSGELLVGNDRDGMNPLFAWDDGDSRAFSSLLGPLAGCGLFRPRFDPESLATVFSYKHLFFKQTMIEGVEYYDPATITRVPTRGGASESRRYWDYGRMGGKREDTPLDVQIDDLRDTLRAAAQRVVRRPGPFSASLSGGLDSRLMTSLAAPLVPDMKVWTFGSAESNDLRIARDICGRLGLEHIYFPIEAEKIVDHASNYITTMNGAFHVMTAFGIERCLAMHEKTRVNLNGYRGGLILGDILADLGFMQTAAYARYRIGAGPRVSHPWLEKLRTDEELALFYRDLCPRPSSLAGRFSPAPPPDLETEVLKILKSDLARVPVEYRMEQFTEEYGGGRHAALLGIMNDRPFHGDASVFYDYEVRDLAYSIPLRHRRGLHAYIKLMQRLLPDLASLEYANTGMPADTPHRKVMLTKILRGLRGRRTILSTGGNAQDCSRHPDVDRFFGEICNDESTRSRPFWNGPQLAALHAEHSAGRVNAATELGAVVGVELFARRWLDGR